MNSLPLTNVMATLADNRCTPEFVASLYRAGMRGVRINSAHVTPEIIKKMVSIVRSVSQDIAILMDTKGAELRTTATPDNRPFNLDTGSIVEIVSSPDRLSDSSIICLNAAMLGSSVAEGTAVFVDDGEIELTVEKSLPDKLLAKVTKPGVLGSRKTVNFRGVEINALPAVTYRDKICIEAGIEAGIDIIAHSFVRSEEDVIAVRQLIAGSPIALISKIECRPAVINLDDILAASDGLLCARGDLGAEVGIEHVPAIEMEVIARCRKAGKPVIVATQFLQTMFTQPTPTRAEAGDIASAVMQGADTLLLCGETAQGNYPRECVEWMNSIINATLAYRDNGTLL